MFSVGWILDRSLGWPNPTEPYVEALIAHPAAFVAVLAGVSLIAFATTGRASTTWASLCGLGLAQRSK